MSFIFIIIVTMIMNIIDLSLVLIYTIGEFITMDVYRIILMQYLTFSLGTLTWSTQLTKSSMVPKAMTQKTTVLIFAIDMHRTNTAASVFRDWPQNAHSVIIITLLLARLYYYCSVFGSIRALQCSRGYE